MTSIIENPTSNRIEDPGVARYFSSSARYQAWLDVEAALAQAEAAVGVIPKSAAETITKNAHLDLLDVAKVNEGFKRTSHMLVPLVWELARISGEDAGRWVHWGATTQNIIQTGDVIGLRGVYEALERLISSALLDMAHLAEVGADMPMAARTHGQHAVPTTFGFKVATWIDEYRRHVDRLNQLAPRLFVAMLGGAAGTFASLGDDGPAVQAELASRLGLTPMRVPARNILDNFAEFVVDLALIASTSGRIGREIYTLMKTEFGEVEEPTPWGTVGSSTMPQKRNPILCQDIIAGAVEVRATVPICLDALQVDHEADRSNTLMMRRALQTASTTTADILASLHTVLSGLTLKPERMRSNLDLSHDQIMAEHVMLELGQVIGRQTAHDVVYDAAQTAATGGPTFIEGLREDERVTAHLRASEIEALMNPVAYVGRSPAIARDAAVGAREAASHGILPEAETK